MQMPQIPPVPSKWRGVRPFERHSLVLAVGGVVYIVFGLQFALVDRTPAQTRSLQIALDRWSPEVWGTIWIVAGLLSVVSSRWPPISDTWGYTVLTGLASSWAAVYLMSILFGNSPWANLTGTLIFGLLGFMWWAVSGLVNPQPPPSESLLMQEDARLKAREREAP